MLLNFVELSEPYSSENITAIILAILNILDLASKLLTIIGNNASNNRTIYNILYIKLSKIYNNENRDFRLRPLMRFYSRASFIRYLVYIINLIYKDILI